MSTRGRTISFRIPDEELVERLDKKLAKSKRAASGYIRELMENDLNGVSFPSNNDPDCIINLAKEFAPFIADDIAAKCEGQDQRKLLVTILISLAGGSVEGIESMQLSSGYKEALKKEGLSP